MKADTVKTKIFLAPALPFNKLKKLKSKVLGCLLILAFVVSGCGGSSRKPAAETGVVKLPQTEGRKIYFAYDDPRYDDKGTGRYRYPLSFKNRDGFLDVTRFTVEDGGSNVIFKINCRRPIDRYREDGSTESKNWWLQMIDIYIDKDGKSDSSGTKKADSGYMKALPGRQIQFDGNNGWEKMILVTPNHSRTVEKILEERTSDLDLVHQRKDIIVPHKAYPQGYTFVVYVPKHELGAPQPHWGYQLLMVPYNGANLSYGHFHNQKINKFASDQSYGGGSDFDGNPNVMDILAPSDRAQYRTLSDSYSAPYIGNNRYAKVNFIYGNDRNVKTDSLNASQSSNTKFIDKKQPHTKVITPAERYIAPYQNSAITNSSATNSSATNDGAPIIKQEVHSFEGGF